MPPLLQDVLAFVLPFLSPMDVAPLRTTSWAIKLHVGQEVWLRKCSQEFPLFAGVHALSQDPNWFELHKNRTVEMFKENKRVDSEDRTQVALLFYQLNREVRSGALPCSLFNYVALAAIQCRLRWGKWTKKLASSNAKLISRLVNEKYVDRGDKVRKLVVKQWHDLVVDFSSRASHGARMDLTELDRVHHLKLQYVHFCAGMPFFGVKVFYAKERLDKKKFEHRWLALHRNRVLVVDPKTEETLTKIPFVNLRHWASNRESVIFTMVNTEEEYAFWSPDATKLSEGVQRLVDRMSLPNWRSRLKQGVEACMDALEAMVKCIDSRQGLDPRLQAFRRAAAVLVDGVLRHYQRIALQSPHKAKAMHEESLVWNPFATACAGVYGVLSGLLAPCSEASSTMVRRVACNGCAKHKLRGTLREQVKANIMAVGDAIATCYPDLDASETTTQMLNTYLPY